MPFETKIFKNGLNRFEIGDIIVDYCDNKFYKVLVVYNDTTYSVIEINSNKINRPGITSGDYFRAASLKRKVIFEKCHLKQKYLEIN